MGKTIGKIVWKKLLTEMWAEFIIASLGKTSHLCFYPWDVCAYCCCLDPWGCNLDFQVLRRTAVKRDALCMCKMKRRLLRTLLDLTCKSAVRRSHLVDSSWDYKGNMYLCRSLGDGNMRKKLLTFVRCISKSFSATV